MTKLVVRINYAIKKMHGGKWQTFVSEAWTYGEGGDLSFSGVVWAFIQKLTEFYSVFLSRERMQEETDKLKKVVAEMHLGEPEGDMEVKDA